MVFSFIAGLVALKILSRLLEHGKWWVFGIYCLVAAGGSVRHVSAADTNCSEALAIKVDRLPSGKRLNELRSSQREPAVQDVN